MMKILNETSKANPPGLAFLFPTEIHCVIPHPAV